MIEAAVIIKYLKLNIYIILLFDFHHIFFLVSFSFLLFLSEQLQQYIENVWVYFLFHPVRNFKPVIVIHGDGQYVKDVKGRPLY